MKTTITSLARVAVPEGEIDFAGPTSHLLATIGLDRGFKNYQAATHQSGGTLGYILIGEPVD